MSGMESDRRHGSRSARWSNRRGEHDWWNKVTLYENGARAPFIIWVPGAEGMGQSTNSIIEFVDIYPTLIELAGLEAPHQLSGKSFVPLLNEPEFSIKEFAYTQVNRGTRIGRTVRSDR